ncbi:MAG: hypothetical protein ACE5OZ_08660 [Candidatus Heimdallarchaeota archaeon]
MPSSEQIFRRLKLDALVLFDDTMFPTESYGPRQLTELIKRSDILLIMKTDMARPIRLEDEFFEILQLNDKALMALSEDDPDRCLLGLKTRKGFLLAVGSADDPGLLLYELSLRIR